MSERQQVPQIIEIDTAPEALALYAVRAARWEKAKSTAEHITAPIKDVNVARIEHDRIFAKLMTDGSFTAAE